jgi:uncharacterized OB-fold protein
VLSWQSITGYGRIYALTEVAAEPRFNVALIDLDEDVRVLACVEGEGSRAIGAKVRARVDRRNGVPVLVFECAS